MPRRKAFAQPMKLIVMAHDSMEASEIMHDFVYGVSRILDAAVIAQATSKSTRRIHLNYSTADIHEVPRVVKRRG